MVVTWSIGTRPNVETVNTMLDHALATLRPGERPVLHTDRGAHYRWPGWLQRVEAAGLVRSMSRKACTADNAACEGFFGRIESEMFYGRSWRGSASDSSSRSSMIIFAGTINVASRCL